MERIIFARDLGRNSEYDGEVKKEDRFDEWLLEDCHAYYSIVNSVDLFV